ncbi:hypothetical protein FD755_013584, partial [Muntiacus reevesi]
VLGHWHRRTWHWDRGLSQSTPDREKSATSASRERGLRLKTGAQSPARRAPRRLDPQKVARFQQLCGVEAPASCTAAAAADPREDEKAEAHLAGESRRRERQPGAAGGPPPPGSDRNQCPAKLGGGGAPNGVRNGRATEVGPASPRRAGLLRRNSLTGEEGQLAHVSNWPLHYLFCFGTELGNELFYILFFPFWIWNLDALVGRRLVVIWVLVMYLGQCTKDIIRWPRPASPPVVKLEVFYNSEYSMPSTHAMSGTAIPVSMVLLTYGRWQLVYNVVLVIEIHILCKLCYGKVTYLRLNFNIDKPLSL